MKPTDYRALFLSAVQQDATLKRQQDITMLSESVSITVAVTTNLFTCNGRDIEMVNEILGKNRQSDMEVVFRKHYNSGRDPSMATWLNAVKYVVWHLVCYQPDELHYASPQMFLAYERGEVMRGAGDQTTVHAVFAEAHRLLNQFITVYPLEVQTTGEDAAGLTTLTPRLLFETYLRQVNRLGREKEIGVRRTIGTEYYDKLVRDGAGLTEGLPSTTAYAAVVRYLDSPKRLLEMLLWLSDVHNERGIVTAATGTNPAQEGLMHTEAQEPGQEPGYADESSEEERHEDRFPDYRARALIATADTKTAGTRANAGSRRASAPSGNRRAPAAPAGAVQKDALTKVLVNQQRQLQELAQQNAHIGRTVNTLSNQMNITPSPHGPPAEGTVPRPPSGRANAMYHADYQWADDSRLPWADEEQHGQYDDDEYGQYAAVMRQAAAADIPGRGGPRLGRGSDGKPNYDNDGYGQYAAVTRQASAAADIPGRGGPRLGRGGDSNPNPSGTWNPRPRWGERGRTADDKPRLQAQRPPFSFPPNDHTQFPPDVLAKFKLLTPPVVHFNEPEYMTLRSEGCRICGKLHPEAICPSTYILTKESTKLSQERRDNIQRRPMWVALEDSKPVHMLTQRQVDQITEKACVFCAMAYHDGSESAGYGPSEAYEAAVNMVIGYE